MPTKFKILYLIIFVIYPFGSYADGDKKIFKEWHESGKPGITTVKFQQYNELCGGCHFAYQPGLLPAISWEKVIADLAEHFGTQLRLSPVEKREMTRFLLNNSAGHVNDDISNNILQSFNYTSIVKRITQTPYFIERHSQFDSGISSASAGACDTCHQDAVQGRY